MTTLHSQEDIERGVTVVVGLMFVLSIVLVAAAQYQINVVPQREQSAEIQQANLISTQMEELRSDIHAASASGQAQSQSLKLGVEYERMLIFGIVPAVHPVDPSGTFESQQMGPQIILKNAENEKSASNYWNGNGPPCDDTPQCYNTSVVTYEADYNHYRNSPTIVYENSLLYDYYPGGPGPTDDRYVINSEQQVVNGRSINLYTVTGNISTAQTGAVTAEVMPVSAPAESMTITNNASGQPLTVRIPTQLPENEWRNILQDEMASNPDGFIESIGYEDNSNQENVLILRFAQGETYNLKMSRIHLSTRQKEEATPQEPPAYLAWRGSDDITIREGARQTITGQVRDRFNNGVSGVAVNATARYNGGNNSGECAGDFSSATAECNGHYQPGKLVSDENGQVGFIYQAPEVDGDANITVQMQVSNPSVLLNAYSQNQPDTQTLASVSGPDPMNRYLYGQGYINGEETLRILKLDVKQTVVPRDTPIHGSVIIENTGANATGPFTLQPTDPTGANQFTADPGSISGITLQPGERRRYTFEYTFTSTGLQTLQIGNATVDVRVTPPSTAVVTGTIKNKGDFNPFRKGPDRFKDGDAITDEYRESQSIPPITVRNDGSIDSTAHGNLYNFVNSIDDSSSTAAHLNGSHTSLGFATFYVPDNPVYTMRFDYEFNGSRNLQAYDATVVGADGEEIDNRTTYQFNRNSGQKTTRVFQLSEKETNHLRQQNDLYMVLHNQRPEQTNVTTHIYAQQLIGSRGILNITEPNVSVTSFTTNATAIQTGEPVRITLTLENTGSQFTKHPVLIDHEGPITSRHTIRRKSTYLNPGETGSVSFVHYFYEPGQHIIYAGNTSNAITLDVSE